jgi:fatty acid desaturase
MASTDAMTEQSLRAGTGTTTDVRKRDLPPIGDDQRRPQTMVPLKGELPDVLPNDRFNALGMPTGELRTELRRIPNARNVVNVLSVWLQTVGMLYAIAWTGIWWLYVPAFFLMGRGVGLFAILNHEAAHRLLFSNRAANDFVGKWFLAAPSFVPFDLYRRAHMAHHKDEMGPDEPDTTLYAGYPITKASWHRKLKRDAFFESGWKNLRGLLLALRNPTGRPVALRILGPHVVLIAVFTATGHWWWWPVLWLAPWMTVWRVLNRLRAIAEHGGMVRSADRRETTHVIEQSWMPRFWMVPFNTGWHLAHHADMGVPFQNLPRLHDELVASGWVTPEITWPSYRAFWQAVSSRPGS